ncbi:hypothetical protein L7F22_034269 [Adiantum nelumboides]|nr:hypothetical protein [Adiantum nelumboides]
MHNYFDLLETSWDETYTAALSTIKSIYQVFLTTEEILLLEKEKAKTQDFVARVVSLGSTYCPFHQHLGQQRDGRLSMFPKGAVTTMTSSVLRLEYPFAGDSLGAPASIALELTLPPDLLVTEAIPEVGWWDDLGQQMREVGIVVRTGDEDCLKPEELQRFQVPWVLQGEECWKKDGITDVEYDKLTRALKFQTLKARPHSIIQRLSRCGFHLMPVDMDGKLVYSCLKDNNVERYACDDIALAISACAIASSKWNAEAGQDSCVVRVLEIPDPSFPPTFEKSKNIRMILYKLKGNGILNMSERKSKEYKEDLLGEFHASIMVTLRDSVARESLEKMEKAEPGFTNCFKRLALGLRLFSFTAIEPPPPPTPPRVQEQVQGMDEPMSTAEQQSPCTESILQNGLEVQSSTLEAPQLSNPA